MNKTPYTFLIVITILLFGKTLNAQLTGSNWVEYQFGNIPAMEPSDLSTLYDQLNLQYRNKNLKIESRIEQFYSTDSVKRDVIQLSQFSAKYQLNKTEIKVGSIYETMGRGLLLRSFEIPSSILEDRSYRVRQGFYRDIQGFSFKYTGNLFRFKALMGKPLNNLLPPGNDERRNELIEAIQPEIVFKGQNIGLLGMRHSTMGSENLYAGIFTKGTIPGNLSYYAEYDRNLSTNPNPLNFDEDDAYGAYFSLNHFYGNYGASFELKKYHNFNIGSGISEPPNLVKEHSYKVLNRSTHTIELTDEGGYQLEIYFSFTDYKILTLNHSYSINKLGKDYIFFEYFAELYWPLKNGSTIKTFADYSKDDLYLENNRYAGGLYLTQILPKNFSLTFESELQLINRQFVNSTIRNIYLGVNLSLSTKISVGFYYEHTTDPVLTDKTNTIEIETKRGFPSLGFTYRPNSTNMLSLFAGERLGGPACTSGVCYEVLDFKGLEIRWTTKF